MSDQVNNRFSLVASFYGPGNIISWLCTVASLFVTWCLHAQHRRKDTITTDLIFALAVPSVAAGHAIAIIFFPAPSERQQTIGELFTAPDDDVVQRAAAVEAALNVCETFSMIAVALIFVSMFHGHLKRTLAVLAVGLFAFSTEAVVFVQTRGRFNVASSNLSRPFLFNFFEVMVCIIAFLALWACVFGGLMAWLRLERSQQQREGHVAVADARLRSHCRAAFRSLGRPDGALGARGSRTERFANASRAFSATGEDDIRRTLAREREQRAMKLLTLAGLPFAVLSLFTSVLASSGIFGFTKYMSFLSWTARLPFFIPKSASGLTELDQMFALCVGIVALSYSLLYAFGSWRKEEERGNRQREAAELEARRQLTMSLALSLLQLLEEQLGQAIDEREREALLERRSQLLDCMSGMA
jgi:hypothetical protein